MTNPHGKSPRGFILSILKLLYWLADYWHGYFVAIRPALHNSSLILCDRYYPDVLVDPVRYRLPAAALCFARFVARLVPPPDLYILLDVPAELLQQRKPEVTCEESLRQRLAYLRMFQSMPNAFIVDAACSLDDVTQQLKAVILEAMAGRAQRRNGNGDEVSLIAPA